MVKRTLTRDGAILLVDPTCAVRLERLKSGVLLGTIVGRASLDVDRKILDELSAEIQRCGRVTLYFDARGINRLARGTKELAVEWGKGYAGKVEAHLIVSSKMVEMMVRVIGLLTRIPIAIYPDSESFLAALRQEIPRLRELPTLDQRFD